MTNRAATPLLIAALLGCGCSFSNPQVAERVEDGKPTDAGGESASGGTRGISPGELDAAAPSGAGGGGGGTSPGGFGMGGDATSAPDASVPGSEDASAAGAPGSDAACSDSETSSLEGVSLRIVSDGCSFTSAALFQGVEFAYELVIEQTLDEIYAFSDVARCIPPSDESGLSVVETLSGDGQAYCRVCDIGRCQPINAGTASVTTAAVGIYPASFIWYGRNFQGPSDTGATEEMGAPFPPGEYELVISATGEWVPPGSTTRTPFVVEARRSIQVLP